MKTLIKLGLISAALSVSCLSNAASVDASTNATGSVTVDKADGAGFTNEDFTVVLSDKVTLQYIATAVALGATATSSGGGGAAFGATTNGGDGVVRCTTDATIDAATNAVTDLTPVAITGCAN